MSPPDSRRHDRRRGGYPSPPGRHRRPARSRSRRRPTPTGTTGRWFAMTPDAPTRVDSVDGRIEFGHASAAAAQQIARPSQDAPRIAAESDIAVGQQHRAASGRCQAAVRTRRGARPGRRCDGPVRPRWPTGRHPAPERRAGPGVPPNDRGRSPSRSSGRHTGRPPHGRTSCRQRRPPSQLRTGSRCTRPSSWRIQQRSPSRARS